ncbi:hypothetical protein HK098_005290 [Nowakowskiella sp. JEL0407]|nr:hypothetical protein HK098_005290 [Nowakowskiella sp. JEL0407]
MSTITSRTILLILITISIILLISYSSNSLHLSGSSKLDVYSQLQSIDSNIKQIKSDLSKVSSLKVDVVGATGSDRANAFNEIYRGNHWGNTESKSGGGSTLAYTVRARMFISTMFKIFKPSSFLDSPCGDCNWQPHIPGIENVQYTGADIVPDVIIENSRKYLNKKNMRFVNLDLVADAKLLPPGQFDIVLCRDAVQHLSLNDGLTVYKGFEDMGAKILITNIHIPADLKIKSDQNRNIPAGQYYPNNPLLPPFNFGLPLFYTPEQYHDGYIKVIAAFQLPVLKQGTGNFDVSIFDLKEPWDRVLAIGANATKMLDAISVQK